MGGEPYIYIEKYQADIDRVLQELRRREFKAGRYNPVIRYLADYLPPGPQSPAPGAKHSSIEEAQEAAAEEGTRSILDIDHLSDLPEPGGAYPLSPETLEEYFGTQQPTRVMAEECDDLFDNIDRGECVYIVLFENGKPSEIMFAGYSYD
ncbi:MAG: hypothetical protein L6R28_18300 [Planctomycetes bacterium]|nr:hypothetical protein [Planctomycetota bacterium]